MAIAFAVSAPLLAGGTCIPLQSGECSLSRVGRAGRGLSALFFKYLTNDTREGGGFCNLNAFDELRNPTTQGLLDRLEELKGVLLQ